MASTAIDFCHLPNEVHLRILHFAGWRSALSLSATSRRFHELCNEPTFWHASVNESFRMHPTNLVRENGDWKGAFRKLATGKHYAWGQLTRMIHREPRTMRLGQSNVYTPLYMGDTVKEPLVDVQCGGWCYSLLTLSGKLIINGSLDEMWELPTMWTVQFPVPDVRVYQHASGRKHIILLTERGEVWAITTFFLEVPLRIDLPDMKLGYPGLKQRQPGTVSKVVAGWNASGVLVEGHGITLLFFQSQRLNMVDVPFLSGLDMVEDPDSVVDFAIGEHFLMAATASGKVFAANLADIERNEPIAPMQMLNFEAPAGRRPINRVVGWFRKFALFNDDGLVHIVDDVQDLQASRQHLEAAGGPRGLSHNLNEMRTGATTPTMVAGLEAYTIVDVAFGDWHYLALTDTGKVLSWGTESRTCGCLGLGRSDVAKEKGLRLVNIFDGVLDTAQVVSFDHPYPEDEAQDGGTTEYAYKIAAAGWFSCALVAVREKESVVFADGISQSLALHGTSDSKQKGPQKDPAPKPLQPPTERGHRGGIDGVPSDAHGGNVSLAEASIAKGGRPWFSFGTSAYQNQLLQPPAEHCHRDRMLGVQSDARGGSSIPAEGSISRSGQSRIGITGNVLQPDEGNTLNEREGKNKRKKCGE